MPRPKVTELDPVKLAGKYFTETYDLYSAITLKMTYKSGDFKDTSAYMYSAERFKTALLDYIIQHQTAPTPENTLPFFKMLAENLTPAGFTHMLKTLRNRKNSQKFRIETRGKIHVYTAKRMLEKYNWTVSERDSLAIGVLDLMIQYLDSGWSGTLTEAETLIREALSTYEEKKKIEADEAEERSE